MVAELRLLAGPPGMVWIPGGTYRMRADNSQAGADEYPKHTATVSGFWMDRTEVTNREFAASVRAGEFYCRQG